MPLLKAAWLLFVARRDTRGFYDSIARQYDRLVADQPGAAAAASFLAEYLGPSAPVRRMLELGCGTGLFSRLVTILARDLHGVDLSMGQLREARARLPDAHLVQGDILHLPYRDASFEAVISLEVLPHFPRQEHRFFAESYRVLAPGGLFLVDPAWTFSVAGLRRRRASSLGFFARMALLRLTNITAWERVPSSEELVASLADAGFQVTACPSADGRQRTFLVGRKALPAR